MHTQTHTHTCTHTHTHTHAHTHIHTHTHSHTRTCIHDTHICTHTRNHVNRTFILLFFLFHDTPFNLIAEPPPPPTNVQALVITDDSIMLTWSPPSIAGTANLSYNVHTSFDNRDPVLATTVATTTATVDSKIIYLFIV